MSSNERLAELVKWPTNEKDVTVDLILRVVGAETQRTWLEKWARIDSGDGPKPDPLYMAQTKAIIAAVGLMACLRALRDVHPEKAEVFACEYWQMCDAGDSFGEMLWEFTEAAGLDPSLIKLPT